MIVGASGGVAQFPNIDPGLAGETGVSGDWGTVYGPDGLKIGAGIVEGAEFTNGGGAESAGFWADARGTAFVVCALACSMAASPPKKAATATRPNNASAADSNLLLRIGNSFQGRLRWMSVLGRIAVVGIRIVVGVRVAASRIIETVISGPEAEAPAMIEMIACPGCQD